MDNQSFSERVQGNTELYPAVEFKAMNTDIVAMGKDPGPLPYWRQPLIHWYESVEQLASRFRPDSELSRFNRAAAGEQVLLSPQLYAMIRSAWSWAAQTDGLFQPFVGTDLCRLGYNRSYEQLNKGNGEAQTEAALCGRTEGRNFDGALVLNDRRQMALKNTTAMLDLGGMGKGWSTDRAAQLLKNSFHVSKGLIDAGGDMSVWSDGEPWRIGVQSPFNEDDEWFQLWLKTAAVATSNVIYRRWTYQGEAHHHILNGRTGLPADTDIVQATVLGPSVEEAEVAAKVICMLGSEQLTEWMRTHFPQLGYLAVTRSGSIKINRKVYEYAEKVVSL